MTGGLPVRRPTVSRTAGAAVCISLCLILISCKYGLTELFWRASPVEDRLRESAVFRKLDIQGGFSFLFASDFHFAQGAGPGKETLAAFADLARRSGASFALFGGDLSDAGLEEEYLQFRAWADTLRTSGDSALPWLAAMGNHDVYNSGWTAFKRNIGPSYTQLSAGPVSVYCIDTADGLIGEAQMERLSADFGSDPKPKIVASHYPLRGDYDLAYYRLTDPRERIAAFDLFARSGVSLVLCGHYHLPLSSDYGKFDEYVAGTINEKKGDRKARCILVRVSDRGEILEVRRVQL